MLKKGGPTPRSPLRFAALVRQPAAQRRSTGQADQRSHGPYEDSCDEGRPRPHLTRGPTRSRSPPRFHPSRRAIPACGRAREMS